MSVAECTITKRTLPRLVHAALRRQDADALKALREWYCTHASEARRAARFSRDLAMLLFEFETAA